MGGGGGGGMEDMFGGGGGSQFGGFGGMPGGRPGGQQRRKPQESAPPPPVAEITRPLALSLEELYKGGTKRLKITRKLRSGQSMDKVLEISYKAGWKKGTKVKFTDSGNEDEYGRGQTLVFVVEEKEHTRFKRQDDDLVINVNVGLLDALTGSSETTKEVEHLDGRRIKVPVPRGVSPRH
jgi:DnaJ family protein B protein 4